MKDAAYLHDMLVASASAIEFVGDLAYEQYLRSKLIRSAVERQVEIVGEAARKVSREFQESHPQIPWVNIQGTRHRLAHDYGDVDHAVLWRVVRTHLPELVEQLNTLLPDPPSEDAGA
ncbi:MAG: DUF86 domain-containing protein [Phycisphaerales bacterium]|nr:DUF86 domain-containing protein [Phycisphaerales bacterium]